METPSAEQLEWATNEIRTYGPLPQNWHMASVPGQSAGLYQKSNEQTTYESHPLSGWALPDVNWGDSPHFQVRERLEEIPGVRHPPQYQDGEWQWCPANNMKEAVIASAFESQLVHRRNYLVPQYHSNMMGVYTKDIAVLLPHQLPNTMYHPSNRRGGEHEATVLPDERKAAAFARALRFSLVVVQFKLDSPSHCFRPTFSGCDIQCRWSLGTNYELCPPLYVGYGMGRWYALKQYGDIPLGLEYEKRYEWAAMLNSLHTQTLRPNSTPFPYSKEALVVVGVKIQRMIRLGYQFDDQDLDDLAADLAGVLASGKADNKFFDTWKPTPTKKVREPILTYDKLTMAIVSGEEDSARAFAKLFDECVAKCRATKGELTTVARINKDILMRLSPDLSRFKQRWDANTGAFVFSNFAPNQEADITAAPSPLTQQSLFSVTKGEYVPADDQTRPTPAPSNAPSSNKEDRTSRDSNTSHGSLSESAPSTAMTSVR